MVAQAFGVLASRVFGSSQRSRSVGPRIAGIRPWTFARPGDASTVMTVTVAVSEAGPGGSHTLAKARSSGSPPAPSSLRVVMAWETLPPSVRCHSYQPEAGMALRLPLLCGRQHSGRAERFAFRVDGM